MNLVLGGARAVLCSEAKERRMLPILIATQALTLLLVIWLLLRRQVGAAPDSREAALLAADLPGQMARLAEQMTRQDARSEGLERHLRGELAQIRQEADTSSAALRAEVLGTVSQLGEALRLGLDSFRNDNKADAERLRLAVDGQLASLSQRLTAFTADATRHDSESREALHSRLKDLGVAQAELQEKLRVAVEARLDKLNASNESKLEEMRLTVDEKLHTTLQTRLTESFGAVTDQLTKVHTGLGEMTKLSAGVDDLSRIFTNVKSRGGFAEVQLGMLLSQMLAPSQFQQNVKVKPNTQELVEYCVKLPGPDGDMLLPIDAKFPREAWERLESAYAAGTAGEIATAGKAFESAIRTEGKRICDKYIAPPVTTSFAIMFLPTEGLYAEVMRRDGLQADIQQSCRVTIAGPSTLSAILNSFQMGFHMMQLQQKGDEVWKVLAGARTQFGKFEDLMTKMDDQVSKVQKTIQEVGTRTRVINRTLRDVSLENEPAPLLGGRNGHGNGNGFNGVVPMLAAEEED
jgi:DNA recombination protein RmuC